MGRAGIWTTAILASVVGIAFWVFVANVVLAGTLFMDLGRAHHRETRTVDCDRGFAVVDWKRDRLKTGQSIAKCDWFDGWSARRVERAIGKSDPVGDRREPRWAIGDSASSIGPTLWELELSLDQRDRVADSRTGTRPY